MSYYTNQNNCPDDRYLQDEIDRLEHLRRQEREQQECDREERIREYRQRAEEYNRSASAWPEALQKQTYLFQREVNLWPADDSDFPDYKDDHFGPGAEACKRALEIWQEVAAARQNAIEALEDQIQVIKNGIRLEVSEKLLAEGTDKPNGWKSVASAIAQIDEDDVSSWLDW